MNEEKILPNGWELVKLEDLVINSKQDLVDGPFGSNLKSSEYTSSGVPVFKIQNIKPNYFLEKKIDYITPEKAESLARHSFKLGDLIITKLGDPLGLCCKVPPQYKYGIIVADLIRLRPSNLVVFDDYLMYAINSKIVQQQFQAITKGTTRSRVNLTIVRDIKIPLPPLAEQHRIVAKIEELFSSLDNGIQNLKTAQQQLKIYRQAVLKWAFEGKLTNNNKIEWITIGEICNSVDYGTSSKSNDEGLVPVLRMGNIQNGRFDWADLKFTSDCNEINKYSLKKNDVLFNRTNSLELVGKTAIYKGEKDAIFAGYLIRINYKKDEVNGDYLNYFLNSHTAKKYGNNVKSFGVNQSNINGTKLKKYPFPKTTLEEQQAIVAEIESRLSICDKLEETIQTSLKQSEILRQSILKKAFSGQLVPQNPNDEPASLLLEKIQGDRAKNNPKSPRKSRKKDNLS